MNMKFIPKMMVGAASLMLSAGVWAGTSDTWDPLGDLTEATTDWDTPDWKMDRMYEPDYMVVDKVDHRVEYLDRVDNGHVVPNDGQLKRMECMKGDTITDLHTKKSGIITGVKRHGTMDVMTHDGKNVRYQYVIFKVKPL
jgi:hypothetical protein